MNDHNGTVSQNLPVLIGSVRRENGRARPDAGFSAQMLGAGGARRGLKGGAPVLEAAREAYLKAQWSGGDRRAAVGSVALKRV